MACGRQPSCIPCEASQRVMMAQSQWARNARERALKFVAVPGRTAGASGRNLPADLASEEKENCSPGRAWCVPSFQSPATPPMTWTACCPRPWPWVAVAEHVRLFHSPRRPMPYDARVYIWWLWFRPAVSSSLFQTDCRTAGCCLWLGWARSALQDGRPPPLARSLLVIIPPLDS